MKPLQIILIVILLSVAARAAIPFLGAGLWWDEAVYLGLAQGISQGHYSLDPQLAVESFRPPLFPALLAPFALSPIATMIIPSLIAVLSILAVYHFSRRYGQRVAFWTTLFTATSTLFVFFSSKLLTEPLFMTFLSLGLLYFLREGTDNQAKAGALIGLAFLTRYLATVFLIFAVIMFLVWALQRKARNPVPFFVVFFLVIAPWILLSNAIYGSPIGAYTTNLAVYAVSTPQTFLHGVGDIGNALNVLVIFLVGALLFSGRRLLKEYLPLSVFAVLTLAVYLALPHKEPRYLLSFFPIYAVLAGVGAARLSRFQPLAVGAVAVILSIAAFGFGVHASVMDVQADAVVQAAQYLGTVALPDEAILTQSYPLVYAVAHRQAVPYCTLESQDQFDACQHRLLQGTFPLDTLNQTLETRQIRYILSYRYEPSNPQEVRDFFAEEFDVVATFEQWGDHQAVTVYRKL